jgi:hypothetical protein
LNHIGERNVEKVAGSERQKPTSGTIADDRQADAEYATQHRTQRRQKIQQQRLQYESIQHVYKYTSTMISVVRFSFFTFRLENPA